ncbi:MAG: transcription termination/antitermination NusG family protein [Pyrinomonadaceae bacterium]
MGVETTQGNPGWYVVQTRPKQEDRASLNLSTLEIETFAPKLKERRFNLYVDQPQYASKPLFPGYIFARFVAEQMLTKVCFTRGVRSVVNFGNGPSQVKDEEIDFIKSYVREDGHIRLDENLNSGDKLMIVDGPFKNLAGIFERNIKATNRVMILLSAIGYEGRVELERDFIRKVV